MRRKTWFVLCCIGLGAAIVALVVFLGRLSEPVGGSWILQFGTGQNGTQPGMYVMEQDGTVHMLESDDGWVYGPLNGGGQPVYCEAVLPGDEEEALLIFDCMLPAALYLDGELFFTQEGVSLDSVGGIVTLPSGYAGSVLTVAQYPSPDEEIAVLPTGSISSIRAFETSYISVGATSAYMSTLFCVLGTVLAAFFAYGILEGNIDAGLAFLCGYSLLTALYPFFQNDLDVRYFPDTSVQLSTIRSMLPSVSYALLLLFFATRMRKGKRILSILAAALVAIEATYYILSAANVENVGWLLNIQPEMALTLWVAVLVLAFVWARHEAFWRLFRNLFVAELPVCAGVLAINAANAPVDLSAWDQILSGLAIGAPSYLNSVLSAMMTIAVFICVAVEFIQDIARGRARTAVMAQELEMQAESYRQSRHYVEQMGRIRHDVRRHLSVLDRYIADGELERARLYIEELGAAADTVERVADSGNYLTDIILDAKAARARELGIQVQVETGKLPAELPYEDAVLVSLLSNSLDNATRAAAQMQDGWMHIRVYRKSGFVVFTCLNSARDPKIPTEGASERGYGLSIIRDAVKRCNGTLSIEAGKDSVYLRVALSLQPQNETRGGNMETV